MVVVDVAELVEVDPEQREGGRRAGGEPGQAMVEGAAVGKPGQGVVQALDLGAVERLRVPPRHEEGAGRDRAGAEHERDRRAARMSADGRRRGEQRRQLDEDERRQREADAAERREPDRDERRARAAVQPDEEQRDDAGAGGLGEAVRPLGRPPAEPRGGGDDAEADERGDRVGQRVPVADDPRRAGGAGDQPNEGKPQRRPCPFVPG
jgi:hypothetical protein